MKLIKFRILDAALVVVAMAIGVVMYRTGYKNGSFDTTVKRIPFDLTYNLEMYEISSYAYSMERDGPKPKWDTGTIIHVLHGILSQLDEVSSQKRVAEKGLLYSQVWHTNIDSGVVTKQRGDIQRFLQNVEKARLIVKDFEPVVLNIKELADEINLENEEKWKKNLQGERAEVPNS